MSVWAECLLSIRFDLNVGPRVEHVSPAGAFTEQGLAKVLQCAFPDCNQTQRHDFIFFFCMRDCTSTLGQATAQELHPLSPSLTSSGELARLYGATYYRQKYDPSVPRGYVQQVVVLLSRLPYFAVQELILRVVVPRFCQCCPFSPDTDKVAIASPFAPTPTTLFELDHSFNPNSYTQAQVLDEAVAQIARWPSAHPRARYEVMLLHQSLDFVTPSATLRPLRRVLARPAMCLDDRVGCLSRRGGGAAGEVVHDVLPLYGLLGSHLHHLTHLWELLITHESLLILSNSPSTASAAAFAVAALVAPIEYNGVLRPYFTVQNEDFNRLSRMGTALPFPTHESILVAATNPFFLRHFTGWHHLLVVIDHHAGVQEGAARERPVSPTHSRAALVFTPTTTTTASLTGEEPTDALVTPRSQSSSRGVGTGGGEWGTPPMTDDRATDSTTRHGYTADASGSNGTASLLLLRDGGLVAVTPTRMSGADVAHTAAHSCNPHPRFPSSSSSCGAKEGSRRELRPAASPPPPRSALAPRVDPLLVPAAECQANPSVGSEHQLTRSPMSPIFTAANYQTALLSAQSAPPVSRGHRGNGPVRSRLQYHLQDHFESDHTFLLDHAGQTRVLLRRLEAMSRLDTEAQLTSVSLSLQQWCGGAQGVGRRRRRDVARAATPLCPAPPHDAAASTAAIFAQSGVADDIVRKFVASLTMEFLTPVTAWFASATAHHSAFDLCDRDAAAQLLRPEAFLAHFKLHHRTTAPPMWTQHHYSTYRTVYERFARGSLFRSFVLQLLDRKLRDALDEFEVDEWVSAHPDATERVKLFRHLHTVVQRELQHSIDPDVLFVTTATSVLAGMAASISHPLREQLMLEVGELKL